MSGAIDHDWDEAERSTAELLESNVEGLDVELGAGAIALDLVTQQPLFVRRTVANDLVEYYEKEGLDLYSYKTHPYLPVQMDDSVYECVYIPHDPQQAHNCNKTYDMPEGRLMKVPYQEAWME